MHRMPSPRARETTNRVCVADLVVWVVLASVVHDTVPVNWARAIWRPRRSSRRLTGVDGWEKVRGRLRCPQGMARTSIKSIDVQPNKLINVSSTPNFFFI